MRHLIKIDFYRAVMPGCASTFDQVMASVASSVAGRNRNIVANGSPLRLQDGGSVKDGTCEGDMIRIQMDDLPEKANLDGAVTPVDFDDDEGVAHHTAFLYHVPLQVLLLERRRSGVSAAGIANYVEQKGSLPGPVLLEPVTLPNAMAKLLNLKQIRHFHVRAAGMNRLKTYEGSNLAVSSMINLSSDLKSPVMEIEMKASRKRSDSISREGVVGAIRGLLGLAANQVEVEKIDVTGRTPEDTLERLHLLDFWMTEQRTLKGDERRVPYEARANALRAALQARTAELQSLFGAPQA